jgi:uncharacterized iron-regulated membrane protein
VFWRDLHSVAGIWISTLALFLLVTALPWTTVWGAGFKELRSLAIPAVKQDWPAGHAAHRAETPREAAAAMLASRLPLDDLVRRVSGLHLDPPVRIYLPSGSQPWWRVRSETQNRPRVRELRLDALTGAILRDEGFAQKPLVDRIVGVGVAAHEGQLFGAANQALGLFTALGLVAICVSAVVMWWRRRPAGGLGIPAPRVAEFHVRPPLLAGIVALGIVLPVFGASLLILWPVSRSRS